MTDGKTIDLLNQIKRSLDVMRGEICCKLRELNESSSSSSTYRLTTTASTNSNNIKSTPGTVTGILINNTSGSTIYVKLYDKATAPTVGTDTPILVIPVAATTASNFPLNSSINFSLGIGIAVTGGAADTDTTNVSANSYVTVLYK